MQTEGIALLALIALRVPLAVDNGLVKTMTHSKRIALLVFILVSSSTVAYAEFPYSRNRMEWVDDRGCLSVWLEQGWEVGDTKIPLRFHFSSYQTLSTESPALGIGWWFPLIESNVRRLDQTVIRVGTISGEILTLSETKNGEYSSFGGEWQGKANGDRFELSKGDTHYAFEKGVIESMEHNGRKFRWSRKRDLVEVYEGQTQLVAFSLSKFGNRTLKVSGLGEFKLKMQERPIFSNDPNFPGIISIGHTLSELNWDYLGSGVKKRIGVEQKSLNDGIFSLLLSQGDNQVELSYDSFRGFLKSDDIATYQIERLNGGGVKIERNNKHSNKTLNYYKYDAQRGVEEGISDGQGWRKVYILNPGVNYLKTRSQEILEDGTWVIGKESFYDFNGRVLKEVYRDRSVYYIGTDVEPIGMPKIHKSADGLIYDFFYPNGHHSRVHYNTLTKKTNNKL